jgi:filamentous hemagglutinin
MQALGQAAAAGRLAQAARALQNGQGTTIAGQDNQLPTGGTNADGSPATTTANAADRAGGLNVSVSIGSSKSQSNSASTSDTARGSTVVAGKNVNITATGAGADSNILIQGSSVKAGNSATLAADNQVNLLAARNESSNTNSNSASSGSLGVSFGLGANGGVSFNASTSKSQGAGNGNDTTFTNTQVQAGNSASITSGGDTTLKGAVVAANQIKADIGGNLNIQSLQNTSTYQESSKSSSASISLSAAGIPTGGSLGSGKTNINSNFASTDQQSGLKAGDGGFQVTVASNTALTGSVISSTQQAVDNNRNSFTTGGQLTTTDLQNQASYNASASGATIGVGTELAKSGAGVGNKDDNASSTTTSGISGIAGNTAVRTGDASTGLQPIFDLDKVRADINAQVAITTAFTQQAGKAVGDYAQTQRQLLQERLKTATTDEEKQQAQQALKDLATQERVLSILIGAVSGNALSAVTKEGLSAAASEMRQLMTADSQKFAGVTDGTTELTNLSGTSEGVGGDGVKIGGTRVDLDLLCGSANERCASNSDGSLALKNGQIIFTAGSLADFLKSPDGQKMSGATGGVQGAQGTLFGIPYAPGSWQDKLIEAFSGTHDMIGGKLSGLYDAQGNATRGRDESLKRAQNTWSATGAIVLSTPFAAAEVVPANVWNAISIFLKAAR